MRKKIRNFTKLAIKAFEHYKQTVGGSCHYFMNDYNKRRNRKKRSLIQLSVRAFKKYRMWGWSKDGKNNLSVKDPTFGGTR